MYNYQLTVRLGDVRAECFLLKNFFTPSNQTSPIHTHKFTEIHMVADGCEELHAEKRQLVLLPGDVAAIPAEMPHRLAFSDATTREYVFWLDLPLKEIRKIRIPQEVLHRLLRAAVALRDTGEAPRLAGYIAYILNELYAISTPVMPIRDRAFIIRDFFEHHYDADVTLKDIAADLYVSEKQAHRLIVKYTGDTFSVNLAKHRVAAAKLLMETEKSLSLSEIAQLVGYRTYSGFWKAYRKYG